MYLEDLFVSCQGGGNMRTGRCLYYCYILYVFTILGSDFFQNVLNSVKAHKEHQENVVKEKRQQEEQQNLNVESEEKDVKKLQTQLKEQQENVYYIILSFFVYTLLYCSIRAYSHMYWAQYLKSCMSMFLYLQQGACKQPILMNGSTLPYRLTYSHHADHHNYKNKHMAPHTVQG